MKRSYSLRYSSSVFLPRFLFAAVILAVSTTTVSAQQVFKVTTIPEEAATERFASSAPSSSISSVCSAQRSSSRP